MNIKQAKNVIKKYGKINFWGVEWLMVAKNAIKDSAKYMIKHPKKDCSIDNVTFNEISGYLKVTDDQLLMVLEINDKDPWDNCLKLTGTFTIVLTSLNKDFIKLIMSCIEEIAIIQCEEEDQHKFEMRVQSKVNEILYND